MGGHLICDALQRKKAMYTAIEKVAAPFCDKIICISDAEKQSALDKKICREDKLQVILMVWTLNPMKMECMALLREKT